MRTLQDIIAEGDAQWPESEPIEHRGWRFTTPFHCFMCGVQIPARQFAYCRCCGGCDVSSSRTARLSPYARRAFAGPHEQIGKETDDLFINPEWLDPATRDKYPVLYRPRTPLLKKQPKWPPSRL